MAGRFAFQKLTSGLGMSRSTSRLASASSRATAPVNRAWEDGTKSLGTALPNSRGLHGRAGGGIGTLSNLFYGAAVRPGMVVPSNHEILRGCGARYLNTRTRRQPSLFKHKRSALVDSFGEGKPACSPDASNNLKLADGPARLVAWGSKKVKGLHRVYKLFIKLAVWVYCMTAGLIYSWPEDSMIPSQRLHCSGCNCRSHR